MDLDIDAILSDVTARGDLVGAAAAVVTPRGVSTGAAGHSAEGVAMTPDTVVWIASMTKAVTALSAMQLVEAGKLDLDAPAAALVPDLAELEVLEGFAEDGTPILRTPIRPITLRHLLTHTAGFGYDFSDARLHRYLSEQDAPPTTGGTRASYRQPLLFDPGDEWRYGISIDWVGQVIEAVTGTRVDDHVTSTVLEPLGMSSSCFYRPTTPGFEPATVYRRTPDGLVVVPFSVEGGAEMVLAGGAIYSTVTDYLRFTQLILGGGELDGVRLVSPETVRMMGANHIGELAAHGWRTSSPLFSNDVDLFPGTTPRWGLSFLINTEPTPEGRAPGSLAWAGLANTYFWIDPTNQVAGVFATQLFPFFDGLSREAFAAVERAAYASL